MEIDLSRSEYLNFSNKFAKPNCEKEFIADQPMYLIYGKNGTGKTTFSKLIQEQLGDRYDVRVFKGFDGILKEKEELELVILGEKNTKVDSEIDRLKLQKDQLKNNIENLKEELDPFIPDSLGNKVHTLNTNKDDKEKEIKNIKSKIAKDVKNISNPSISEVNYSIKQLDDEFEEVMTFVVDRTEVAEEEKLKELLLSKQKIARSVGDDYSSVDLLNSLNQANELIASDIKNSNIPDWLTGENQDKKIAFAKHGIDDLNIKKGDRCAFCGHIISQETFIKLNDFFHRDDIDKIQNELSKMVDKLNAIKNDIDCLEFNENDFYPSLQKDIVSLKDKLNKEKKEILRVIDDFINAVKFKISHLMSKCSQLDIKSVEESVLDLIIRQYNKLVEDNNKNDLSTKQKEAQKKLRFSFIINELKKSNYAELNNELKKYSDQISVFEDEVNKKK